MSNQERGELVSMWLLAADREGTIPDDQTLVARLCFMDSIPDLERFIALGFLERRQGDAKTTPTGRQHDAKVTPRRRQGDAKVTHQRRVEKSREESEIEKKRAGARDAGPGPLGGAGQLSDDDPQPPVDRPMMDMVRKFAENA